MNDAPKKVLYPEAFLPRNKVEDCQGERPSSNLTMSQLEASCEQLGVRRPFLRLRTTAADIRPSIMQAADEARAVLRKRILADVEADFKLGSRAQTIYWLRGVLKDFERNGSDGA